MDVADYAIVLRALVHRALGRLVREPHLHVERALGLHAYEDALSLTELGGPPPGPPSSDVVELLAGDPYADVKPALAAAARAAIARLDPVAEEPRLQVLTQLAHRQERHLIELPPRSSADPDGVRGVALEPEPAPAAPARDPYVEIGREEPGLHADLNAALVEAEVAARIAHEQPDLEWAVQLDLIRVVSERLRETAVLDARLAAAGEHWGDRPVSLHRFAEALAHQRQQLVHEGRRRDQQPAV